MTPAPRRLLLGEPIRCSDGVLGELADIVLDPRSREVTHLVARSDKDFGRKRLVPYELIRSRSGQDRVSLDCTPEEAHGLTQAQEITNMRIGAAAESDPDWEVGAQDTFPVPHYDAGAFVGYQPDPDPEIMQLYDRIPKGHVEVRRESLISTEDGHSAGTLAGVQLDGRRVTHLVLRRGHLWRRRSVMLPMDAVVSLRTDEVTLRPSSTELRNLPQA